MNLIISDIFTLFVNIAYMHLLLTRKRNIKYAFFVFMINSLTTLFGYIFSYIFLKHTIFYEYIPYILGFTFIVYISLVFEESISKKVFTMFTIWLFSNMLLILCSYIISLFSAKDFKLYITFSILLRDIIQLGCIPIIYFYFQHSYKERLKFISNQVINIISFYSIIIFIFLIRYYELYSYKPINSFGFFNSLLFIIIIILSYIIIFIAILSVNRNMELEYKFKIIDAQIELQKQNYRTLNKSLENYYAFKHDVRHHVMAIKSMLDTKNFIAASEYVNKFNETEASNSIEILCKNFTIDSILKYYKSIAMNNNIEYKVDFNIPDNINIDNLDLTIVIGNCVENAIEACNNIMDKSKKYINIKAEIKNFNLLLKIKNNFNGQVIKEDNLIKTCKNGEGHGIGLSNVRKITEKYNGFFDIRYTDSEFEVCIVMNFH